MWSFRLLIVIILLSSCFRQLDAQHQIILPAHTAIQLSTLEEIRAAEAQPGDLVMLRVLLDVRVKGELIIRNGAFAQAQVRLRFFDAHKKKPELILVPTTVQTVTGTMIPLYGDGLIFGGRGKSARLFLPTSSKLSAAVHYSTKLFLK